MLQDIVITQGVSKILQRAERQQDVKKIVDTFVDVGILPQIENFNNQIIYGRRGTGKTHVLKVLESDISRQPNIIAVYIDSRTLGSTSQFSDTQLSLKHRCTCLFRDILGEIHSGLREYVTRDESEKAQDALASLYEFGKISTEPYAIIQEAMITDKNINKEISSGAGGITTKNISEIGLSVNVKSEEANEKEDTIVSKVTYDDKVVFPALQTRLKEILSYTNSTLYLLIDEWSSIPFDIQPYLSEFIKRSFLPNANIVVKIASLEYRSNFLYKVRRTIFRV